MKTLRELTPKELYNKYKSKAADSFKTKFDLYIFNQWLENSDNFDATLINPVDFDKFQINQTLIDYYTSFYWQELESEVLRNHKTIKETANILFDFKKRNITEIAKLKKHYIEHFQIVYAFEHFKSLVYVSKENFKCHYCGITIELINQLINKGKIFKKHITRGFTLEIDRERPNEEYKKDNCVLCCYWCNNAKTDEFLSDEFIEVGRVFSNIWRKRLTQEK